MLPDKLFHYTASLIGRISSGAEGHGDGGVSTHLYNLGKILDDLLGKHIFYDAEGNSSWADPLYFWLVAIGLVWIAIIGFRGLKKIPQTRLQCFLEIVVDGFTNLTTDVLGSRGKPFTAYIGTLFIFILVMNLLGLVPLGHSPTSSLNSTAAMAICTFLLVQYHGIRQSGFWGYIKHFWGEPVWMGPLNFPLHIIGELAKPFSLSLRLFGNITGEDTLVAVMVALSAIVFGKLYLPIPIQFPFYFLAMLGSVVQALIFALLTAVYLSLMMAHGNDEEH